MYQRILVRLKDTPGSLGKIAAAIGEKEGNISIIGIRELIPESTITREILIQIRDKRHGEEIKKSIQLLPETKVLGNSYLSDTASYHLGGKLATELRAPIFSKEDLLKIYTPGAGEISELIAKNEKWAKTHTTVGNTIAVITDGSAVLGLGNVGPLAAAPVIEGKCAFLKMFGGLNAEKHLIFSEDAAEIIQTIKNIAPAYAAILLEDIAAPKCFTIEKELQKLLDLPVVHDDQHQTAIAVLTLLINAVRLENKILKDLKVVISGAGAGGIAVAKTLIYAGIENVICCDTTGIIHKDRKENMNPEKEWIAENTNPETIKGPIAVALKNANVFIGLSKPGAITTNDLNEAAQNFIFLPLANPIPELWPNQVPAAKITGTGRSDFPNQINNALSFPGFFRGLVEAGSPKLNPETLEKIKIQVAYALANTIKDNELNENYIIPDLLNPKAHQAVRKATIKAIKKLGLKR